LSNAAPADAVLAIHRAELQVARDLASLLIAELVAASAEPAQLELAIEVETEGERSPARRNAMLKAVSLPGRAVTLRDLATTLQRLIALERQAFGIEAKPPQAARPQELPACIANLDAELDELMRDDSEPAAAADDAPSGA
jgi:hypothetical protein